MTDPDALLAEAFAADEPPAADAAFVLGVMERVEAQRLRLELGGLVLGTVGLGAACWALAPALAPAGRALVRLAQDPSMAVVAGAGLLAVFLWAWVSGRAGLNPA
jgi:hypothetical protein